MDPLSSPRQILAQIMSSICDYPEEAKLREIRIANASFQADIAQWVGGEECLLAIGFRQVELMKGGSKQAHWVLPEPVLDDLDAWPVWFDHLKDTTSALRRA